MSQLDNLLTSAENQYKGCWVDKNLPYDLPLFTQKLQFSLEHWRSVGIKVVWLTITDDRANLIPQAMASGFNFHHVSNTDGRSLVLTKRLIDAAIIPDYANHTIGVGGIVTNQLGEVLTIVEKHDMQSRPGNYKFPGGAVDRKELLQEAVIREILEETGIKALFKGIVGFRHYHRGQFDTSNIYFLCHLVAESHDIFACEVEIGAAKWMKISDYLACDTAISFNKTMLKAAVAENYLSPIELDDFIGLSAGEYEVYHNNYC